MTDFYWLLLKKNSGKIAYLMFFDLFCLSSPLWPWQSSPPVKFSASYNTSFTSLAQFAAVTVRALLLYVCFIFIKIYINKTTKHMIVTFFVWARKITCGHYGSWCGMHVFSFTLNFLPSTKKKKKKDRTPDGRLMRNGRKSVGTVRLNIKGSTFDLAAWYPRALRAKGRRERWERLARNQNHSTLSRWSLERTRQAL